MSEAECEEKTCQIDEEPHENPAACSNEVSNGKASSSEAEHPADTPGVDSAMYVAPHPLDQLSAEEVKAVATAINAFLLRKGCDGKIDTSSNPRFNAITLKEPPKAELLAMTNGSPAPPRQAHVIFMTPASGLAYEAIVKVVSAPKEVALGLMGEILDCTTLTPGTQPLLSPDDCILAESIVKEDAKVVKLLEERYGITDIGEGNIISK